MSKFKKFDIVYISKDVDKFYYPEYMRNTPLIFDCYSENGDYSYIYIDRGLMSLKSKNLVSLEEWKNQTKNIEEKTPNNKTKEAIEESRSILKNKKQYQFIPLSELSIVEVDGIEGILQEI